MHILYLTNNPNLGSTARVLLDWVLLAADHGIKAAVALQQDGDFAARLRRHGIPHYIGAMPRPDRWRPWPALRAAWSLSRWARHQGVQIVDCNEHDVYPFTNLLRKLLRVPVICRVQFLMGREFSRWAFGRPARQPAALIWTSEAQKRDCTGYVAGIVPEERQHVIPLGLNLASFGKQVEQRSAVRQQWGIQPGQVVVGAASALRAHKRIDDFLQLIVGLRRQHLDVVGVMAGGQVPGDEAYAAQIIPRMRALEAEGFFRWIGHQEPIEPFMQGIDLFISTSEYETFGMSVCEAMACRKPVAGYAGGSVPEVVGDTGRIVTVGDLAALTAAVSEVVQSSDLRMQLGERARRRVAEEFDPARSFARMVQIYHSACANRKNGQAHKWWHRPAADKLSRTDASSESEETALVNH